GGRTAPGDRSDQERAPGRGLAERGGAKGREGDEEVQQARQARRSSPGKGGGGGPLSDHPGEAEQRADRGKAEANGLACVGEQCVRRQADVGRECVDVPRRRKPGETVPPDQGQTAGDQAVVREVARAGAGLDATVADCVASADVDRDCAEGGVGGQWRKTGWAARRAEEQEGRQTDSQEDAES